MSDKAQLIHINTTYDFTSSTADTVQFEEKEESYKYHWIRWIGLPVSLGMTLIIIAIQFFVCKRQIRNEQRDIPMAPLRSAAPPGLNTRTDLPASAYPRQPNSVNPATGFTETTQYGATYGLPPSYEEATANR